MYFNKVQMTPRKITLGTKEWADSNINCFFGCSNDCRYCYAKLMAIRFKRKTNDTWKIMKPNQQKINKEYRKHNGRIMFPTSHDITEESLDKCLVVLEKLLKSGNKILITSKPNFKYIKIICEKFKNYIDQIQFRFTITSNNNDLLKFWEPNAPSFEERLSSLKLAFDKSFKTSVSVEPFLDKNPIPLIKLLIPFITESIWIGKMNYIKANNINGNEKEYYDQIRQINSKSQLMKVLKDLKELGYPKIKIKDSIINYLSKDMIISTNNIKL